MSNPGSGPAPRHQRVDARAAENVDPAPGMLSLVERGDGRADHPIHHAVRGLEHGHVEPSFAAGGGHFEADIATADDDHPPSGREFGAQPVHVRDAAQVVHAGQFRAGQWQQARMTARGQQQPVVFDGRAVGDLDAPPRAVDADGRKAQPQVDAMVQVVSRVADEQPIPIQRSSQKFLR